jgi:hypothetical protein
MHIHVVTSQALRPVAHSPVPAERGSHASGELAEGPITWRHPVYLGHDLRTALAVAGHRVDLHALPHTEPQATAAARAGQSGPGGRATGGDDLPFAESAQAGPWLAEQITQASDESQRDVVVHALDDVAAAAALASRRRTGLPVVVRGAALTRPHASRRARLLRQACLRAADAVIAPSAHDLHAMLTVGVARERLAIVPDVVLVPHGDGHQHEPTRRIVSLSGAAAARMLAAALRWVPEAELVVAGGAEHGEVERLQREAERLNLADRVNWLGWIPRAEAVDLIDSADVVAVPGPEGVRATTPVEAMWRGRPVVAADLAPLDDAVATGTTGLLARPGDAHALGTALRTLLDDPFRQEALGQAGADRAAARYSPELITTALERIYGHVTGGRAAAAPADPSRESDLLQEAG